jgi:hypothetical protein
MKTVNSQLVEFGYELIAVIPYAYWLHSKGQLKKTISGRDTSCLYYFSPDHEEVDEKRHWNNMRKLDVPNKDIHVPKLDKARWLPPELARHYHNNSTRNLGFDLAVCNKYVSEWFGPPVNFIDCETLNTIFENNKDKNILYNRLRDPSLEDHAKQYELADDEVVKSHSHVTTIQELIKKWNCGYNEAQLNAYGFTDRFISVQGGLSVLCSYFGGKNTIYAKRGQELMCGSYKWYKDFSGCEVDVVTDLNELEKIKV